MIVSVHLHFLSGVCPDIEVTLPYRVNLKDEFIMEYFLPKYIYDAQSEEAKDEFDGELYKCVCIILSGNIKGPYQHVYLKRDEDKF